MRLFLVSFLLLICFPTSACKTTGGPHKKIGAALATLPRPFAKTDTPSSTPQIPAQKANRPSAQRLPIGTVHHVSTTGAFVVVKSRQAASIEPGTPLISYAPDGRVSATLTATAATKRSFLSAELASGSPSIRDRVVADLDSSGQGAHSSASSNQVQFLE